MAVKFFIDDSETGAMNPQLIQQVIAANKSKHDTAYMITRGYFPDQHLHAKAQGLEDKYLINMYDYFLGITDVPEHAVRYRFSDTIDKTRYLLSSEDWGYARARRSGTTYGRIDVEFDNFMPGDRVSAMHFIDRTESNSVTDLWDWRGFKTATQYFQRNGALSALYFYSDEGDVKARSSFMYQHLPDKPQNEWPVIQTSLEVMDFDGEAHWYENEFDAWNDFLPKLVAKYNAKVMNQPQQFNR
jgi:hypothetical protein